jgi:hypothetical protein
VVSFTTKLSATPLVLRHHVTKINSIGYRLTAPTVGEAGGAGAFGRSGGGFSGAGVSGGGASTGRQ